MISIDVDSAYIRIVDLKVSGKDIQVQKFVELPVEGGFIRSDFSLDSALFKNAIRGELSKMTSKDVAITFSCLPHLSNVFTIPYEHKEEEMYEMIKSRVYQTLSPKEYIMDYRIVDSFVEADIPKCVVIVFMAPRKLVEDAKECLLGLDKRPLSFGMAQNNVYDFAQRYLKHQSLIMAHISKSKIDAHLIHFPDNIMTRTVNLNAAGEMDVLASLDSDLKDKEFRLEDIISKLQQYYLIQYPGQQVEAVYLIGDQADQKFKAHIENANSIPTYLLSDLDLPLGTKLQEINNLLYAIGGGINVGR